MDEAVERAWQELLANWDEPAAHQKFIELSASLGALSFAGKKYREIADSAEDPRAPGAKKSIESVLARAMLELKSREATEPPRPQSKLFFVALGMVLFMIAAAAIAMNRR